MVADGTLGPFRPGPGRLPPHLTGREAEQGHFRAVLHQLADGATPPSEIILYGPRGNGKTALLRWLEDQVKFHHPEVEVERRTPAEIPDRARLAEEFLPRSWWKRHAPSKMTALGLSWSPGRKRPRSVREILATRAAKRPLIVLLDEAHTLVPDIGRELLNASQILGEEHPFLLVLAGTPNLRPHLNAMDVSFWNRARQFRIGRLDDADAAAAFERPLDAAGVRVRGETLAQMVAESQRYPFFIQLLGQAVWERLATSGSRREVTPTVLDAARSAFDETKGEYYLHRFDELRSRRLLAAGRTVAEAFRARAVLGDAELEGAVVAGLGGSASREDVERASEELSGLGFIWRTRARPEWEPGIPSLMDYVREHAPAG